MTLGVEFDFIVSDSLAALALYEKIFPVERIEVTALPKGQNEVIFSVFATRFHMLDENEAYQMVAPSLDAPLSFWFNVSVEDIVLAYENALKAGCTEIQPVTEVAEFGLASAMFKDPFGYVWMLQQLG